MAGKDAKKIIKSKKTKLNNKPTKSLTICSNHDVTQTEANEIQDSLLKWYDKEQRVLPWRNIAKMEVNSNVRGYAVWVSEIMLQQTQVATVVSYFNKWMEKWPTVESLAAAKLEEVYQVWAGLGYYSRARRLHEGAKIIMEELNGKVPQNVSDLMKFIPGIGTYSASAIASVAFQKVAGVVDGNVIRVLSRLRVIGMHVSQQGVRDHLWNLANKLVSHKRPGDFNQALMELGAVICTPQNPKCIECPVNNSCSAYSMVKKNGKKGKMESFLKKEIQLVKKLESVEYSGTIPDIENVIENCSFCLPSSQWEANPQVTAFPPKIEKKKARSESVAVVVIERLNRLLITQRPGKGLLAGLWEFPSKIYVDTSPPKKSVAVDDMLKEFGVPKSLFSSRKYIGEVIHLFSHIHTTYVVEHLILSDSVKLKSSLKEIKWITPEEMDGAAVSTAMKKILAAVKKYVSPPKQVGNRKRKRSVGDSKQTSIKSFFK